MREPLMLAVFCTLANLSYAGGPPIDGNLDLEPNDVCDEATLIDLEGLGSALILGAEIGNGPLGAADVDLYAFRVPQHNAAYLLTATMTATNHEFDGYLQLFEVRFFPCNSAYGIGSADDNGNNLNPVLKAYLIQPPKINNEVWHAIVVSHSRNQRRVVFGPNTNNQVGIETETSPYTLSIEVEPAPTPFNSIEPNDDTPTLIDSVPMTLTNQFIGDGPNGRDDVDRYEVMLEGPSIVTAEVVPTQLTLLDPVLNGIPDRSRPDLRIARSTYTVFDEPSVEIIVSDPYSRTTGFYNLSIDVQPITSDPADGPLEPNDSILQATETGINGVGKATMSAFMGDGKYRDARGDADYYRITLGDGQLLYLDVIPTDAEDPLQSTIHLFDPLGARIEWWSADANGEIHAAYKPPPLPDDEATYYVLVSAADSRIPMDPLVPKAMYEPDEDLTAFQQADQSLDGGPGDTGAYDLTITVTTTPLDTPGVGDPGPFVPSDIGSGLMPGRLFAVFSDEFADAIVELDPDSGDIINQLPVPELPLSSSTGLAFDGTHLYVVGVGRYPILYRLDPDSGDVLDQMTLWFGSGWFGDMAVLGDWLYMVDMIGAEVYRIPKSLEPSVRRLDIGQIGAFAPAGPIAVSGTPPHLFVMNAQDQTQVLELDEHGIPLGLVFLDTPCPCDADFDADGDVDDDDRILLEDCFTTADGFPVFECVPTDLNCDDMVNGDDLSILNCLHNGPDAPPNTDCCPDDLPPFTVRATSLTGQYHSLVAGDWTEPVLYRFSPHGSGASLGKSDITRPVSAVAGGWLTVFGDEDADLDLDILDWGGFQDCFELPMSYTLADPCSVFDWDFDGDVDLADYNRFQMQMSLLVP